MYWISLHTDEQMDGEMIEHAFFPLEKKIKISHAIFTLS